MQAFTFVHTADLHLDSPFIGLEQIDADVAAVLKEATFRAFDNIIKLCIESNARFLLVAGDVFDFRERVLAAQNIHNDFIAGMVRDRLLDPKGNRGSDILLMFYAKGHNPAMWRELPPRDDSARDTLRELRQMAVRQRKTTVTVEETVTETVDPAEPAKAPSVSEAMPTDSRSLT